MQTSLNVEHCLQSLARPWVRESLFDPPLPSVAPPSRAVINERNTPVFLRKEFEQRLQEITVLMPDGELCGLALRLVSDQAIRELADSGRYVYAMDLLELLPTVGITPVSTDADRVLSAISDVSPKADEADLKRRIK